MPTPLRLETQLKVNSLPAQAKSIKDTITSAYKLHAQSLVFCTVIWLNLEIYSLLIKILHDGDRSKKQVHEMDQLG